MVRHNPFTKLPDEGSMSSSDGAVMQGRLDKRAQGRGGKGKGKEERFHSRYFVLTRRELRYYSHEGAAPSEVRGTVDLRALRTVRAVREGDRGRMGVARDMELWFRTGGDCGSGGGGGGGGGGKSSPRAQRVQQLQRQQHREELGRGEILARAAVVNTATTATAATAASSPSPPPPLADDDASAAAASRTDAVVRLRIPPDQDASVVLEMWLSPLREAASCNVLRWARQEAERRARREAAAAAAAREGRMAAARGSLSGRVVQQQRQGQEQAEEAFSGSGGDGDGCGSDDGDSSSSSTDAAETPRPKADVRGALQEHFPSAQQHLVPKAGEPEGEAQQPGSPAPVRADQLTSAIGRSPSPPRIITANPGRWSPMKTAAAAAAAAATVAAKPFSPRVICADAGRWRSGGGSGGGTDCTSPRHAGGASPCLSPRRREHIHNYLHFISPI